MVPRSPSICIISQDAITLEYIHRERARERERERERAGKHNFVSYQVGRHYTCTQRQKTNNNKNLPHTHSEVCCCCQTRSVPRSWPPGRTWVELHWPPCWLSGTTCPTPSSSSWTRIEVSVASSCLKRKTQNTNMIRSACYIYPLYRGSAIPYTEEMLDDLPWKDENIYPLYRGSAIL